MRKIVVALGVATLMLVGVGVATAAEPVQGSVTGEVYAKWYKNALSEWGPRPFIPECYGIRIMAPGDWYGSLVCTTREAWNASDVHETVTVPVLRTVPWWNKPREA